MPQARNIRRHFRCRNLPAFAGLRTLRHLDFDFGGVNEIFGGHAESAGSDLLHAIRGFGFANVDARILTAFARIASRVEAVHGDG